MSNIPNLASLARLRLGSGGGSTVRRKAFGFDGVDDYISSNATIGRTGYDMNVSGNVTTGSDGGGSYIQFNGNRDGTAATGTVANVGASTTPAFNQGTSVTIKVRFKFTAFPTANVSGLFGSNYDFAINLNPASLGYGVRGSSTVTGSTAVSINTLYDMYLVYDTSTAKFFAYLGTSGGASTLLNVGGTSGPATRSTDARNIGDNAIISSNAHSANKYIYHACIRNKALTQAEIDADIALGNTTKQDPSIVAYYVPDNLQFNTDYITTKDFSNAARTKTGTTVTSGIADIRGGTNAYTLTMSAGAGNGATITNYTVTGATLASKTFIMKVFARTASGTATMRLRISHNGVSTYYGADQTVTTTPQEFTFTQALTSSTSGTGMTYGIEVGSAAGAATINVFYPADWLTNQTLRDESPNIGGFIGRKTSLVMSARVKLGIDSISNATKQVVFQVPRRYLQFRDTGNILQFRSETALAARTAAVGGSAILGNGNRNKVHVLGVSYRDGTGRLHKSYVNGVQTSGAPVTYTNTIRPASTIYRTNASVGFYTTDYYNGNIRDPRVYTFTGSFTDSDALAIYNGGEPTSAGVTKYLHYKPPVGEVGTTTQDLSPNDRDGTLNGGVTRIYL